MNTNIPAKPVPLRVSKNFAAVLTEKDSIAILARNTDPLGNTYFVKIGAVSTCTDRDVALFELLSEGVKTQEKI